MDSGTIETTEPGGTVSKWPNNMGIAETFDAAGAAEYGFDAHKDDGKFGLYPAGNFEIILQYFEKGAGFAEEYKGTTKQSAGVMPYYTIPFEQDPSGKNVRTASANTSYSSVCVRI